MPQKLNRTAAFVHETDNFRKYQTGGEWFRNQGGQNIQFCPPVV